MMTGSLGLALLDLGQQFEAALSGQSEVEQDQIEVFHFEHAQPCSPSGTVFTE